MKFFSLGIVLLFLATSCSKIEFLLSTEEGVDFLKNNTSVYVDGWDNPLLKEVLTLKLGEMSNKRFILKAKVDEKQTKRSVSENQVAQKIDYEIKINYVLDDTFNKCISFEKEQISNFSFTPKSSGHNFASDVLLGKLFEEAIISNVDSFTSIANARLASNGCLDEN